MAYPLERLIQELPYQKYIWNMQKRCSTLNFQMGKLWILMTLVDTFLVPTKKINTFCAVFLKIFHELIKFIISKLSVVELASVILKVCTVSFLK